MEWCLQYKRTDEGLGDCWMRGNQLIVYHVFVLIVSRPGSECNFILSLACKKIQSLFRYVRLTMILITVRPRSESESKSEI